MTHRGQRGAIRLTCQIGSEWCRGSGREYSRGGKGVGKEKEVCPAA